AVGARIIAIVARSLAVGARIIAIVARSLAVGARSLAIVARSLAVGARSLAIVARSLAVGARSLAIGARRLAIGARITAVGARSLAVGARSLAIGARSLAIGARIIAVGLAMACAHGAAAPRGPAADVRAEVDKAETAEKARQHDVARAHYQRAIAAARDAESIAFARHEYAETLVSWGEAPQRAEQLAPRDTRPRTALAALYWKRGDRAAAAREYRGLLELDLPDRLRAKVEWALAELAKR